MRRVIAANQSLGASRAEIPGAFETRTRRGKSMAEGASFTSHKPLFNSLLGHR
jgi:hypothetical protein